VSILIIGGMGLVGLHTTRRFLRAGYPVIIYDPYDGDIGDLFEGLPVPVHIRGDVNDFDHLLEVVDRHGIRGAVHAALGYRAADCANDPFASFSAEVQGTFKVLEAARVKNLRLVCVSTQAVYGPRDDLRPVKEDDRLNPVGLYPCWKAMCDLVCINYHLVFGVDVVITRLSWVYGPHRRGTRPIVEQWLRNSLAGVVIEMADGAEHQNDWTYVEDASEGIFLAYSVRPIEHRIFNISQGKNVTFQELAQTVMDLVPGARIKLGSGRSVSMTKASVPMRGPGDITRARKELGFEPHFTIQKGAAELLSWIKTKEPLL